MQALDCWQLENVIWYLHLPNTNEFVMKKQWSADFLTLCPRVWRQSPCWVVQHPCIIRVTVNAWKNWICTESKCMYVYVWKAYGYILKRGVFFMHNRPILTKRSRGTPPKKWRDNTVFPSSEFKAKWRKTCS